MNLIFFLPNIFEHAESLCPGHGVELVQTFDSLSNIGVLLGVVLGVFLTLVVQSLLSRVYRSARYQKWRAVQDEKLLRFIHSRRGKDAD